MPRVLKIAIREAIGKRGVSVIVIPGDVALQPAVGDTPQPSDVLFTRPALVPSESDVNRLADLLNVNSRITLLCGSGCAGAQEQVLQLAEKLKAPIVMALKGKEHLEGNNPYQVGLTGLIGFSSGYHAMRECDVLLMLGTDFPYQQFFPESKDAQVVQVDILPENLGRRTRLSLGIVGDVTSTLTLLLPQLQPKADDSFLRKAVAHYQRARRELDDLAEEGSSQTLIHPQYVAKTVNRLAAEDAIFTCDVGLPTVWAARYLSMNGRRRLLGSFWHGSMANAMAQSIGAQKAFPNRQVVSFSGDGGFTMLMGDFLSLAQLGLPVKVIVFNNGALSFIELEQRATGFLSTGTDLKNPNFAAMAEAVGIRGIRVEHPSEVEPAIADALAHDGPVLPTNIFAPASTPAQSIFDLSLCPGGYSGDIRGCFQLACLRGGEVQEEEDGRRARARAGLRKQSTGTGVDGHSGSHCGGPVSGGSARNRQYPERPQPEQRH
jgi:pyruvate dehydrogenase (quinone)